MQRYKDNQGKRSRNGNRQECSEDADPEECVDRGAKTKNTWISPLRYGDGNGDGCHIERTVGVSKVETRRRLTTTTSYTTSG